MDFCLKRTEEWGDRVPSVLLEEPACILKASNTAKACIWGEAAGVLQPLPAFADLRRSCEAAPCTTLEMAEVYS